MLKFKELVVYNTPTLCHLPVFWQTTNSHQSDKSLANLDHQFCFHALHYCRHFVMMVISTCSLSFPFIYLVLCPPCCSLLSLPESLSHTTRLLILQLLVLLHCRSPRSDDKWANLLQTPAGESELWANMVWPTQVEAIQLQKYMGASHNEMWQMLSHMWFAANPNIETFFCVTWCLVLNRVW